MSFDTGKARVPQNQQPRLKAHFEEGGDGLVLSRWASMSGKDTGEYFSRVSRRSSRDHHRHALSGPCQPRSRQRLWLIDMNDIKTFACDQPANCACGP